MDRTAVSGTAGTGSIPVGGATRGGCLKSDLTHLGHPHSFCSSFEFPLLVQFYNGTDDCILGRIPVACTVL